MITTVKKPMPESVLDIDPFDLEPEEYDRYMAQLDAEQADEAEELVKVGNLDAEAEEPAPVPEEPIDPYLATCAVLSSSSAQREIFYKALCMARSMHDQRELIEAIRALPEMLHPMNTPRYYLETLGESGGLLREEIAPDDLDGSSPQTGISADSLVSPSFEGGDAGPDGGDSNDAGAHAAHIAHAGTAGAVDGADAEAGTAYAEAVGDADVLPDEEAEPVVLWTTSEAGERIVEEMSPDNRIAELCRAKPRYAEAFGRVIAFCNEKPRTRVELEKYFEGDAILENPQIMPSFFADKLEHAGALVWNGKGWCPTEGGLAYLAAAEGAALPQ